LSLTASTISNDHIGKYEFEVIYSKANVVETAKPMKIVVDVVDCKPSNPHVSGTTKFEIPLWDKLLLYKENS
jgi:hypothetical protein